MKNKYGFNVFWSDEDEGYISTCPDFPGLSAFGETLEEALREAEVALGLFVESFGESGEPLPEPSKLPEYSGQIRLRMPKSLHAKVSQAAHRDGVSLNAYLVSLISQENGTGSIAAEVLDAIKELGKKNDYQSPFIKKDSGKHTEKVLESVTKAVSSSTLTSKSVRYKVTFNTEPVHGKVTKAH